MEQRARSRLIAAALAALLAGCGGSDADSRPPGQGATESRSVLQSRSAPRGELLISAAASLTDAFSDMESAFERAHPEVDVRLNLAGSSALRAQILEGAPVDVFASASRSNMDRVVGAGEVAGEPVVFARNLLQIAVPRGNPSRVRGLHDLADEELLIGLCAEGVPCGDFAREALARAGVTPAIDTNEPDVRALLTKVELGEIDAAITYVTDVASTGGAVEGVDVPETESVVAAYLVAVLAGAPNPAAAAAFVDFVLSEEGQAILEGHGFADPGDRPRRVRERPR